MSTADHGFQTDKILTISAGHFVHDIFSGFLPVFLPLLIEKFELSMFLAGTFTVFFRLPSLFNPLLGILSDRVDLRYAAICAPGFTAVLMSILGIAPSYALVCVFLVAAGFSAAVFHVLGPVMIARASDSGFGRGMSFWMTSGELARTVGPLFAVWAISQLTFEGCYPVMALGIFASLFLFMILRKSRLALGRPQEGGLRAAWASLRGVMIPLTGVVISRSFMVASLAAFLPTYMVSSGKSLWIGGTAMAVMECAGTVGSFTGGTLSDRIGRRTILMSAIPASSLLMLGMLYGGNEFVFPALILLGFTLFSVSPVNMAIVQEHAAHCRGTANGLYMGINFLTTAAVTVLVGQLADMTNLKTAFTACAVLGLAGIPAIFFLPEPRKKGTTALEKQA
ncbi:MFS transporter [Desulfonema ishimotonii]|uniref:MFS transporter n=1 Tax=Desulfonema ishimotonii TaxID=45657 RepID=A0A401FSA8_9BACT|nr:MFS transporter [Desulfonema ishimotonii]GBC59846.1 MFS transporter [Desulfonema ishimotonii]